MRGPLISVVSCCGAPTLVRTGLGGYHTQAQRLGRTGLAVTWHLCWSGGSPCPCTSWWILDHWTTREIQNRTFFNLFKLKKKKVTKSKHEALRACSSDHPPASSPFILFHSFSKTPVDFPSLLLKNYLEGGSRHGGSGASFCSQSPKSQGLSTPGVGRPPTPPPFPLPLVIDPTFQNWRFCLFVKKKNKRTLTHCKAPWPFYSRKRSYFFSPQRWDSTSSPMSQGAATKEW